MADHASLTGAELHEPKGADTATSGTVYVADGSGSGTWQDPLADINNLNTFDLTGKIDDISTASSSFLLVVPRACSLQSVRTVMGAAITVADSVISIYINNVLKGQSITIAQSGSAKGITDSLTLTPVYDLVEGDVVEFRSDGGSTDTSPLFVTATFTV